MSDFHVINYKDESLKPAQYNQLHEESLSFLKSEINKTGSGKVIVVTHHVPTFFNYPQIYKGDILNEGFGVELFEFIETSKINYWIFGHHHFNTNAFTIGNTKLLTNQLGYVSRFEHELFRPDAVIMF
ncbi:MAG TPA: metallophosphoesterase, partial [Bacteroidales bacterium]|nr:metallophosphoesterase [Bacteroidales bacterium]